MACFKGCGPKLHEMYVDETLEGRGTYGVAEFDFNKGGSECFDVRFWQWLRWWLFIGRLGMFGFQKNWGKENIKIKTPNSFFKYSLMNNIQVISIHYNNCEFNFWLLYENRWAKWVIYIEFVCHVFELVQLYKNSCGLIDKTFPCDVLTLKIIILKVFLKT